MLIENFYFYLPKIYGTILTQISKNEQSEEFAIFITFKTIVIQILQNMFYHDNQISYKFLQDFEE